MTGTKKIVIAVDLDKTLAYYERWGDGEIGEPVPAMLAQVKEWLGMGYEVRILTARVAALFEVLVDDEQLNEAAAQFEKINQWVIHHVGRSLVITAVKSQDVTEIWDDRAVRVEANTGVSELHDAHARLSAAGIPPGSLPQRMRAMIDLYVTKSIELHSLWRRVCEMEDSEESRAELQRIARDS